MKIVLASASPRRKELLARIVSSFDIIASTCEENSTESNPCELVKQLSYDKGQEVFLANSHCLVIGCDTIVELDGVVYGKPRSYDQAFDMLSALSGKTHNVHTGVTVFCGGIVKQFVATTKVKFNELSREVIDSYIATNSCYDKAGGYGIQDSNFVSRIIGSYDNVMGLPTEQLSLVLDELMN